MPPNAEVTIAGSSDPVSESCSRADLEAKLAHVEGLLKEERSRKQRSLARLSKNSRSFWVPHSVTRRPARDLTALEFVRDYVAASQPLVLTDLSEQDWPCLKLWRDDAYLLDMVGELEVSVNATPDGRGDSVDSSGRFVKPCEERMPFRKFWDWLQERDAAKRPGVPYLSRQNDSLRDELPALVKDIPEAVPVGVSAFGNEPEAVNLWIGDERAVSSCHKDHYENLYTVVRGEKIFTLLPPTAVPFLHERCCPPATFERRGARPEGRLEAVLDSPPESESMQDAWAELGGGRAVPWIPFDVSEQTDFAKFPDFMEHGRRLAVEVHVKPGEMLYLPAMWYHRVAQKGLTVAVNYWHDMQFGHAYVNHRFLRDITGLDHDSDDPDSDCEDSSAA